MQIKWKSIAPGNGHEEGRRLLAELYREYTGEGMPGITVTDRGKPCFVEGGLHFSISHTKRHVFCVLSDKPVGIDAEEEDRDIDLRLAEKILSARERSRYEQAGDKRRALLKLWVLKEAAAKLTGEGLRGYPDKTDFSPEDERVQSIDGCYVAVITD